MEKMVEIAHNEKRYNSNICNSKIKGMLKAMFFVLCVLFLGYSTTSAINWDNDNFIDQTFWDQSPTDQDIKNALYGSSQSDTTAYTKEWTDRTYSDCNNATISYVSDLPATLNDKTIYVLDTDIINTNRKITMGLCSAIISKRKGGTTINSTTAINGAVIQSASKGGATQNILNFIIWETTANRGENIIDNIGINGGNSTYGIYVNGRYVSLNNVQTYNTTNGIYYTDGVPSNVNIGNGQTYGYGTINNVLTFNNSSYGIYIDGLQYMSLNNIQAFNNANGINPNACDNIATSNILAYNNNTAGLSNIIQTDNIYDYNNGNSTTQNWNHIINPVDGNGNYLLDWNADLSTQKGKRTFNGPVTNYSIGSSIMNISGKYLGTNITVSKGNMELPASITTNELIVTGISDDNWITNYSIFGNIASNIIGESINNQTTITLSEGYEQNTTILQLYGADYFATHIENPIIKGDVAPECIIDYDIWNLTNKDVIAKITCNQNVTITNNDGNDTYTFVTNGEYTFNIINQNGVTGQATATVNWIDKEAPDCSVSYSTRYNTTTATLTCNEQITILNNNGRNTCTVRANNPCNFEYTDAAGNTGTSTAYIQATCTNTSRNFTNGILTYCNSANAGCTLGNNNKRLICVNKGINSIDDSFIFAYSGLTEIYLSENNISSIQNFKEFKNLTILDLAENNISNLSNLQNLTNLTTLYLANNDITDISYLSKLINLTGLNLSNNNISNISYLQNINNLSTLNLNNNNISNINILENKNLLSNLYLGNNNLSNISILSSLNSLSTLDIEGNKISNLSPLNNKNITTLNIQNNEIFDIDIISTFNNLSSISLGHNCIDWTGLDSSLQNKLQNINANIGSTNYGEQFLCKNGLTYTPPEENGLTNSNVIAAINIIGDQTKKALIDPSLYSYTFTENGTHDISQNFPGDFIDNKTGILTANVTWIDKIAPICSVEYDPTTPTSGNVVATLTGCSEEITITNNDGSNTITLDEPLEEFTFTFQDNAGNTGETTAIASQIDRTAPTCELQYNTTNPTNGNVVAALTGCSEDVTIVNNSGNNNYVITENGIITSEFVDIAGNLGTATGEVNRIDRIPPTFEIESETSYECSTGTIKIINATDENGLRNYPYKFNDGEWIQNNIYYISGGKAGTNYQITGYVMDFAGNTSSKYTNISFIDTGVTANDFSILNVGSGVTINWKAFSEAKEGDCNAKYLSAEILSNGSIGICEISGSNIIYTANTGSVGSDLCQIEISDMEGNNISIRIDFNGIVNINQLSGHVSYSPNSGYWTSGNVTATLHMELSGNITSEGNTGFHTFTENGEFLFTYSLGNLTGETLAKVDRIDKTKPSFYISGNQNILECTTGLISIQDANDYESGLPTNTYSFDGNIFSSINTKVLPANKAGEYTMTGFVIDNVGNIGIHTGIFQFIDVGIEATGFSITINVGGTVSTNRKIGSQAIEGNCGNSFLSADIKSQGTHGICFITGDSLIYEHIGGTNDDDSCIISINDTEGNTKDITISILYPGTLELGVPGALNLSDNIQVKDHEQEIIGEFSGSYFSVSDGIGGNNGRYTTIAANDLSGDMYKIDKSNISIKSKGIATLHGTDNNLVAINDDLNEFISLGSPILYIFRDPHENNGIKGTYGDSPYIKIKIPAYQGSDNYHTKLIFTIYDN